MGRRRTSFEPRKHQRRNLFGQDSFREVTLYSPRGSEVVAGSARQARKTAKRNMSPGPRVLSFNEEQTKSSREWSGFGADMCQLGPHWSCKGDDFKCATTNPMPSEIFWESGSNSHASTLPGSLQDSDGATPPMMASREPTRMTRPATPVS